MGRTDRRNGWTVSLQTSYGGRYAIDVAADDADDRADAERIARERVRDRTTAPGVAVVDVDGPDADGSDGTTAAADRGGSGSDPGPIDARDPYARIGDGPVYPGLRDAIERGTIVRAGDDAAAYDVAPGTVGIVVRVAYTAAGAVARVRFARTSDATDVPAGAVRAVGRIPDGYRPIAPVPATLRDDAPTRHPEPGTIVRGGDDGVAVAVRADDGTVAAVVWDRVPGAIDAGVGPYDATVATDV